MSVGDGHALLSSDAMVARWVMVDVTLGQGDGAGDGDGAATAEA